MTCVSEIAEFWNRIIDPFNWRDIGEEEFPDAWQKARLTALSPEMRQAIDRMGRLRKKRILLLGAGLGSVTVSLAEKGGRVMALDIAEKRCRRAKKMVSGRTKGKNICFVTADAEKLPFSDGCFHYVIDQDVLMYSAQNQVVPECKRVLAHEGKAVFVESMSGHPLVRLFRKCFYDQKMAALTRHLTFEEMKELALPGMVLERRQGFYLLSIIAFGALYLLRSVPLYRLFLRTCHPIDCLLLKTFPILARFSWKCLAVYRKSSDFAGEKNCGSKEEPV